MDLFRQRFPTAFGIREINLQSGVERDEIPDFSFGVFRFTDVEGQIAAVEPVIPRIEHLGYLSVKNAVSFPFRKKRIGNFLFLFRAGESDPARETEIKRQGIVFVQTLADESHRRDMAGDENLPADRQGESPFKVVEIAMAVLAEVNGLLPRFTDEPWNDTTMVAALEASAARMYMHTNLWNVPS